jgi:hypothetical protein
MDNIQPATFRGEIAGRTFEETGTVQVRYLSIKFPLIQLLTPKQEVWAKLKTRYPEIELEKRDVETRAVLNKVSSFYVSNPLSNVD